MTDEGTLDALDVALAAALREHRRAGILELPGVAGGTVSARLQRLEDSGVITGFGPDIDVRAAGSGAQAFVTLEIAQGAIEDVRQALVDLGRSASVVRSTSVVALPQLAPWRTVPLLQSEATPDAGRSGTHLEVGST